MDPRNKIDNEKRAMNFPSHRAEQDVRGLQVAVQHGRRVNVLHTAQDLVQEVLHVLVAQPLESHHTRQCGGGGGGEQRRTTTQVTTIYVISIRKGWNMTACANSVKVVLVWSGSLRWGKVRQTAAEHTRIRSKTLRRGGS